MNWKRLQVCISIIAIVCIVQFKVTASHIFGGDISYKSLGGLTYEISLVLYGDCSGNSFPNLYNSTPNIDVYNGNTKFQTLVLDAAGTPGLEVTPVCPSQAANTSCKGGSIPGVAQFIFKKNITLNTQSADWRFVFAGTMGTNGGGAGRSGAITNITIPAGSNASLMMLEATLNNTNNNINNSATYTTIPTPFFCINTQQAYNQGAVDDNTDELTFELVSGLDLNSSSGYVDYTFPYTAQLPLATVPGSFNFDITTGQMTFIPSAVQQSLVVTKVTEKRNGVVVGTSMREMTFVVLANCSNQSPSTTITSSSSGTIIGPDKIVLCNSIDTTIDITLQPTDPDGDNIAIFLNGMPNFVSYNITGNGTSSPSISIKINASNNIPLNSYTFYVTSQDNGCPLSSKQTQAFTIEIIQPIMTNILKWDESCAPGNDGKIIVNASSLNGGITYSLNQGSFQSVDTFAGLQVGNYNIQIKDAKGCILDTSIFINVPVKPVLKVDTVINVSCNGSNDGYIQVSTVATSGPLTYTLVPGGASNNTGIFTYVSPGSYAIIVRNTQNCYDTVFVAVSEPPVFIFTSVIPIDLNCGKNNGKLSFQTNSVLPVSYFVAPLVGNTDSNFLDNLSAGVYTITATNQAGCQTTVVTQLNIIPNLFNSNITADHLPCFGRGDEGRATVVASNGIPPYRYEWNTQPPQLDAQAINLTAGWYVVKVTDNSNCEIKDTVYIEPGKCCESVFLANAFTPDGDGKNDEWGIVSSTGMEIKHFMVVNRWGQKVWEANHPRDRWDGYFVHRIVEPGTYYYFLKYKCLSDQQIYTKQGDLTIIR